MERWMDIILKCERDWRVHRLTCEQCTLMANLQRRGSCITRDAIKEQALQAILATHSYRKLLADAVKFLTEESW